MPDASRVTPAQAEEISRRHYRIDGAATRLDAEIDDAFWLQTADGTARLLKISVLGDDPRDHGAAGQDGASLQTALLLHLAATAPELPVQRVVPTPGGLPEVRIDDGTPRLVRITSWLDGQPVGAVLGSAAPEPAGAAAGSGAGDGVNGSTLRRDIGATLGRLNLALRGFQHPGADRTHRWDLQSFGQLRPLLDELGDIDERAALVDCLDRFDEMVVPQLATARRQVVHTDFHGDNLLTDGTRVTGILDFGDALTGPIAMDVGVAACYQLGPDPDADPLPPALEVVAGYHAVDPLTPDELPLIAECIAARLATRIIVSQWNAAREPANSGYLLRRTATATRLFNLLRATRPDDIHARLRTALESAA
jgi:Ser/Thr protein kinase RdoA (MazF antagonist)